ncbi:MAG: hypothetical protein AB3A66_14995 [Nodularia sp. CChRGM 3473]
MKLNENYLQKFYHNSPAFLTLDIILKSTGIDSENSANAIAQQLKQRLGELL